MHLYVRIATGLLATAQASKQTLTARKFMPVTRWKLWDAVKSFNQALASLAVEKHPDKTFIGRIERGFDFLGYHFSRAGLTIARKTIADFIKKASQL